MEYQAILGGKCAVRFIQEISSFVPYMYCRPPGNFSLILMVQSARIAPEMVLLGSVHFLE